MQPNPQPDVRDPGATLPLRLGEEAGEPEQLKTGGSIPAVNIGRPMVMRMSPFFDAERFASQFAMQEAHDHMLEALKKAGFH